MGANDAIDESWGPRLVARQYADEGATRRVLQRLRKLDPTPITRGQIKFRVINSVDGVLSLNVAGYRDQFVEYFPVVAVIHPDVSEALRYLMPSFPELASSPTISARLSYLADSPGYRTWRVATLDSISDELNDMVEVFLTCGMRFVERCSTLSGLLAEALAFARGEAHTASYLVNPDLIIPTIYCIQAKFDLAEKFWHSEVSAITISNCPDYSEYDKGLRATLSAQEFRLHRPD